MKLFDIKKRRDHKPANHCDNIYDFYDRSSWKWIEEIRNLLNLWYSRYPKQEKGDLRKRFQREFSSAFFELFLHELFLKEGFELIVHPTVPGTSKKPDFLVFGKGLEFYLEAKESTDKSDAQRSLEGRIHILYDILNETYSPNFFFRINELILKSDKQPSGKKIKAFLENRLPNFDPEKIQQQFLKDGLEGTDKIFFENEEIKLTISLLAKSPELRGKEGVRPIGIYQHQSFVGGADDSIKTGIEKKATRYGKLDKPYLICINATSDKGLDQEDMLNALFGTLQITFSTDPNNKEERWTRALDGVFLNASGPKFTRVSGVFITNVHASNLHLANHWLVKHPFGSIDFPMNSFNFQKVEVINNRIEIAPGTTIKEILDIPDNWMAKG